MWWITVGLTQNPKSSQAFHYIWLYRGLPHLYRRPLAKYCSQRSDLWHGWAQWRHKVVEAACCIQELARLSYVLQDSCQATSLQQPDVLSWVSWLSAGREIRKNNTCHFASYGVAVIPRPARIVWDLIWKSFREENIALWETSKSFTTLGSERMTNRWFPSQNEYIGPYFSAHLSRISSGLLVTRNGARQPNQQTKVNKSSWAFDRPGVPIIGRPAGPCNGASFWDMTFGILSSGEIKLWGRALRITWMTIRIEIACNSW